MSLPSNLAETTQIHLELLVTERVQEGAHLEYKSELPARWTDDNKQEFLADVTAMANATGGDLIYGVQEGANAEAEALIPQNIDADADVRRLQDFLLNLVEPRIPGVQVFAVPLEVGDIRGHAVVVRAPQSWAGPHRVSPTRRFHIRENGRKRDLNVPEIRGLFLRSEGQAQRIRDFRTERLGKILIGDLPCKLVDGTRLVVHVVPLQSALGQAQVDPTQYANFARHLPILSSNAVQSFINMDGALSVRPFANGATHGYSQIFRDGIVESVQVLTLAGEQTRATLRVSTFEPHMAVFLRNVRTELALHNITGDVTVLFSILHADKARLLVPRAQWYDDVQTGDFDRKTLVIPDFLATADTSAELALKPVFDFIWQCAGHPCSLNYNANGQWAPIRDNL